MIDRLAHPELLLLLIPAALCLLGLRRRAQRVRLNALAIEPSLRARLTPLPGVLRFVALVLLTIALARPQEITGETKTSTEGVAMQIVIDRSSSMGELMSYDGRDMRRLDVVKEVMREFVLGNDDGLEGRPDDMIGLITFAQFAETIAPLSRAREAVVQLADGARLAQRHEDGTAIGEAIALAAARLKHAEEQLQEDEDSTFTIRSKIIVLLTDGEETVRTIMPGDAATKAAEWGVKIYAIGIGRVRDPRNPFSMLRRGVDESTLRLVADRTEGRTFVAEDAATLREVYEAIDALETTEIEVEELTEYEERFMPFAIIAAALMLLETLLRATVLRRLT